tara:strand:+ start:848 stop:1018 length:171 start_codon:yes stop_codon:yes gene_type:complete
VTKGFNGKQLGVKYNVSKEEQLARKEKRVKELEMLAKCQELENQDMKLRRQKSLDK